MQKYATYTIILVTEPVTVLAGQVNIWSTGPIGKNLYCWALLTVVSKIQCILEQPIRLFRNISSYWRETPCVLLEIWNILIRFRRLEEIRSPRSTKLQLSCSPVSSCLRSSKNWEILSSVYNIQNICETFIKQL